MRSRSPSDARRYPCPAVAVVVEFGFQEMPCFWPKSRRSADGGLAYYLGTWHVWGDLSYPCFSRSGTMTGMETVLPVHCVDVGR